MVDHVQELRGNSIVLLGDFDLSNATLGRLVDAGHISDKEVGELKSLTVLEELIAFELPWISVSLEVGRLHVATNRKKPLPEPIRDFIVGVLAEMPSSRIRAAGINTNIHFEVGSKHDVVFSSLLNQAQHDWISGLKNPKARSMTMRADRDDALEGYLELRIEQSNRMGQSVYLLFNDHVQFQEEEQGGSREAVFDFLIDDWAARLQFAEAMISEIRTKLVG